MSGLLHLVDHTVPVAGRVVLDPDGGRGLSLTVDGHEDRELLVGIASNLCWYGVLLWGVGRAFIVSPRNGCCTVTCGCCAGTC